MDEGGKKPRLVENWREVLRRSWSVKLAAVAPFMLTVLWEVLSAAPPEVRALVPFPLFLLLCGVAILARILDQPK